MAEAGASGAVSRGGGGGAARLRLMCSHGGRFVPCGPDGGLRYVGGETRVLVVPREVPFRELAARLGEMAGAEAVAAVRYRLVDEGLDDVLVSVTCDDDLAHMRDEYDRPRATSPSAIFRVFVSPPPAPSSGARRPGFPLAATMSRAQSEQALAARAHLHPLAAGPEPMRRVYSARELAGGSHLQPCYYHQHHQCYRCCCHLRRGISAPVAQPTRPMYPLPSMSRNANGLRPGCQEPAPAVSAAKAASRVIFTEAAREMARCRDAEVAMQKGRAFC